MKAIEEIQQLDPNPRNATANNLNVNAGGSRPFGGQDPKDKKKQAIREAVQQRLRRK